MTLTRTHRRIRRPAIVGAAALLFAGLALGGPALAAAAHPQALAAKVSPKIAVTISPRTNLVYGSVPDLTVSVTGSKYAAEGTITVNTQSVDCSGARVHDGKVQCELTNQYTVGYRTVTVTYSGDQHYRSGTGSVSYYVARDSTSITVQPSTTPIVANTPVTLYLSVYGTSSGVAARSGSVRLYDDAGTLPGCDSVQVKAYPGATQCTMSLPAGTHEVTLAYTGAKNFAPVFVAFPLTVESQ